MPVVHLLVHNLVLSEELEVLLNKKILPLVRYWNTHYLEEQLDLLVELHLDSLVESSQKV